MKKYLYVLSSSLLLVNIAVCQTTKVYHFNSVTFNNGTISSSHGGGQNHTITLTYVANNKLIMITDELEKPHHIDTYVIDIIIPPTRWSLYDLDVKGHKKQYPNFVFEFTHKTKGVLAEQFVITETNKDGYPFDDGSKSIVQILTNK